MSPEHKAKIELEAKEALAQIKDATQRGDLILYLDEFCTTKMTIPWSDWSARKDYLSVDPKWYHRKTLATIVAVSRENGLELASSFDKSVNAEKFITYLKKVRQKHPFKKLSIFCDRLQVHRS